MTTNARDHTRHELLLNGLADWVHLAEIHHQVAQDNPDLSTTQLQQETLNTIRSLVTDGLFEVGDLGGADGKFAAWAGPIDESLQRISRTYVDEFDERNWIWRFWLQLTDEGRRLAEELGD